VQPFRSGAKVRLARRTSRIRTHTRVVFSLSTSSRSHPLASADTSSFARSSLARHSAVTSSKVRSRSSLIHQASFVTLRSLFALGFLLRPRLPLSHQGARPSTTSRSPHGSAHASSLSCFFRRSATALKASSTLRSSLASRLSPRLSLLHQGERRRLARHCSVTHPVALFHATFRSSLPHHPLVLSTMAACPSRACSEWIVRRVSAKS
jgi:hypothetical protein